MSSALYPGSFDPITLGHMDIIKRASRIFDEVIVCVMNNSQKHSAMFSLDERKAMVQQASSALSNVKVIATDNLLTEIAEKYNISILVRGLRSGTDFEYEQQTALINSHLDCKFETVFFPTSHKYISVNASAVRELIRHNAPFADFSPVCIPPKM